MKAFALLLALALLAGCTSLPFGGSGDLTAKDAEARGLQRARQWHADAALAGLAALEHGAASAFGNRSDSRGGFAAPEPDGSVGDGRTTAWMMQFRSPSANGTLGVVVYRNGTVLAAEDEDDGEERAVATWNVDSPQAAQVAMQDANFSAAARAGDGGIAYALGMGEDSQDPFWILTAGSESARTGGIVLVNARTGERLDFPGFPGMPGFGGGFPMPPGGFGGGFTSCREAHQFGGSVGLQDQEQQHDFEVEGECDELEVHLQYSRNLPLESLTLELQGPDGEALQPREDPDESEGTYEATFDVAGPGEYVAIVRASSEVPVTSPTTYSLEILVS